MIIMVDWKKFCEPCRKRGNCCCGFEQIYVTPKEEALIREKTGVASITDNHLLKKKTTCIFMKEDGLCGIHGIKPLDCRAYPIVFWSDAGHSKVSYFLDLDCPAAMSLTEADIKEIEKEIEPEIKTWTQEDLYRYDVCAYWKPEKVKDGDKKKAYPFGTDL